MTQKTIRRMSTLTARYWVLVGGTALMYLLDTLSPVSVGMYVVLAAVCFFGCPVWFTHKARKNVHRTIERASNRHICGPKTLRLTDTGVQLVGESEDSSYPYAAFQRVVTAEKQVYLYLDDLSALIVPRACLPGRGNPAYVCAHAGRAHHRGEDEEVPGRGGKGGRNRPMKGGGGAHGSDPQTDCRDCRCVAWHGGPRPAQPRARQPGGRRTYPADRTGTGLRAE